VVLLDFGALKLPSIVLVLKPIPIPIPVPMPIAQGLLPHPRTA